MQVHNQAPPYCASCFQQNPGLRHVDFESVWDGPVFPGKNGDPLPVDDLIICESCIRGAAVLLGMTDEQALLDELAGLKERVGVLQAESQRRERYLLGLEAAVKDRPELVKKPGGRPPTKKVAEVMA